MAVPSIPTGQIASAAGKIGVWLWSARREQAETNQIMRQALRVSLCRYDPCAPGVDELAASIEARMWHLAKQAPDRTVPAKRFALWLRAGGPFGRRMKTQTVDFPRWERELGMWVEEASRGLKFGEQSTSIGCRSFPASAKDLGERFPLMFYLEVGYPNRMNSFRRELLARLNAADDLKDGIARHSGPSSFWLTGSLTAAIGTAGLTAAEIARWSDPGLIAGAGGFLGLVAGLVMARRRDMPTDAQSDVRANVRLWLISYLQAQTQAGIDEPPLMMLQQVIEEESAVQRTRAHASATHGERLSELRDQLVTTLIPATQEAEDGFIYYALTDLQTALDEVEARGAISHALHVLLNALDLAPLRLDGDKSDAR